MIFSAQDIHHPINVCELIQRSAGEYPLEAAANTVVEILAKFENTAFIEEHGGVRTVILHPRVVENDTKLGGRLVSEFGAPIKIDVQGYNDLEAIKSGLARALPELKAKIEILDEGQWLEFIAEVSNGTPRTHLNANWLIDSAQNTTAQDDPKSRWRAR